MELFAHAKRGKGPDKFKRLQDFLLCALHRASQDSSGCGVRCPGRNVQEAEKEFKSPKLSKFSDGTAWTHSSRLVRQVFFKCVKPTLESIFGDLIDSDVKVAVNLARDWIDGKNRSSNAATVVPCGE